MDQASLRADALAGLTNAAIVLPQGVAFAIIAGLPPEYGLFTAMITPIVAAIWGSSMIMISGPTTAISAVMFATLIELAPPGTPIYVNLALTLTILVGFFQLLAGLFRLSGLIAFISHSVMVGFTAAAALLIGASQLSGALGISVERGGGVIERVMRVSEKLDMLNVTAAIIAISAIATIVICQRLHRHIPAYLVALAVGIFLGEVLGARSSGIEMFKQLPSLFPSFEVPQVSLSQVSALLPGAASIAFVGLLEAISIGRSFAMRRKDRYDSGQEIIGQGMSNIVGGFFHAYAGSGSFTRSALNMEAGARTPLSAVFSAFFLLALLLFFAPFADRIPVPAISGIILYVAWRLINFREIRHILQSSRSETSILVATFIVGITTNLENAIFAGIIFSLVAFLYRSARPHLAAMAPVLYKGRRQLRGVLLFGLDQCPQIMIQRLEGPLFFASVEHVEKEFRRFDTLFPGRKLKLLSLKGLGNIDLAGADLIVEEAERLRKAGGNLRLVAAHFGLVRKLHDMHVIDVIGVDHLHATKAEAIAALMHEVDESICAKCELRAFMECANKPAPEGIAPYKDPVEIKDIHKGTQLARPEHNTKGRR